MNIAIKRRLSGILLMIFLSLSGCARTYTPLEELPEDYSIELAKEDHCVVFDENNKIIAGQEMWNRFFKKISVRSKTNIRLVRMISVSLLDEEILRLWIEDLSYDGHIYTLRYLDDGKVITKTYAYLKKYEGKTNTSSALYENYTIYALVNDNSLTWEDLISSSLSSFSFEQIDYHVICMQFE